MPGLTQRDARSVLDFLQAIAGARDLSAFRTQVSAALPRLVPCELATYNELDLRWSSVRWTANEPGRLFPGALEIFQEHLHQNPYLPYRRRTGDPGVVRLSDLLSARRFRDTGLYREFYRPLDLAHSMAGALSLDRCQLIAIAVYRGGRDFSAREAGCLAAVQGHVAAAYRTARLLGELSAEVALLEQGEEMVGRGLIAVGADGRIRMATRQARACLARHFGQRRPDGELPDALGRWLRATLARREPARPTPPSASFEGGPARLLVRVIARPTGCLLLLEERTGERSPAARQHLRLSVRESEVLALVAEGHTSTAIAERLACSPRTVQTYVERACRKLEVHTRAAAAACLARESPATHISGSSIQPPTRT